MIDKPNTEAPKSITSIWPAVVLLVAAIVTFS